MMARPRRHCRGRGRWWSGLQLRTALVLPEEDEDGGPTAGSRNVQVASTGGRGSRGRVEVYSKGDGIGVDAARGGAGVDRRGRPGRERIDVEALKQGLSEEDPAAFYRARGEANIQLGPQFRTLQRLWCRDGEAVGEVVLPDGVDGGGSGPHPVLLDGFLQVMGAARTLSGVEEGDTYLPFAWDRFWLTQSLPERVICHARMRDGDGDAEGEGDAALPREVLSGDLRLYTADGIRSGADGYVAKRATRAALLSGTEGVQELLYEVIWEDHPLAPGLLPADFLPAPAALAAKWGPFADYLGAEGVSVEGRAALLSDLERMAWSVALTTLERLGWTRTAGETVEPEALRDS